MCGFTFVAYGFVAVASLFSLLRILNANQPNLDAIPTVGHSGFPFFYVGAIRYLFNAKNIVQEGYDKFKGGSFKMAKTDRWLVVVCGTKLVDELRKAPNDVLSSEDAVNDMIQTPFTVPEAAQDPRRVPMVISQLTRKLDVLFPELRDEIVLAFGDHVPVCGNEWTKLPALETVMKIVTRVGNRLFVGLPLCQDADFTALNIQFATDIMVSAAVISLFPGRLKPLAGRFFSSVPACVKRGMGHLAPIIEKRLKDLEKHGKDSSMKPNDMISLLIDTAKPEQKTSWSVTQMILGINFVAVHTSSLSFTHALFHLAAHPEVILPLREEVEAIVAKEGWTKAAIGKMDKVDSFLRESQRFSGLEAFAMTRKALKGFTFSDGTHIPVGTTVAVASASMHHDEDIYTNAETFNASRFSDMREEDGESVGCQMVNTGVNYISFGHGKHACPGRFFAAIELKAMLAHVVTSYDIKLENEGVRPADRWFANTRLPNLKAELMFRARQKPPTGI